MELPQAPMRRGPADCVASVALRCGESATLKSEANPAAGSPSFWEETALPARLEGTSDPTNVEVVAVDHIRNGLLIPLNRRIREDLQLARNVATQVAVSAERFHLSAREAEVLGLLVLGDSNAEIAGQLFVSHRTVKNHLGAIYERMGVRNRVEAATVTLLHQPAASSVPSAA
jgi:DNA-binding CsgD family transcriptional regulator